MLTLSYSDVRAAISQIAAVDAPAYERVRHSENRRRIRHPSISCGLIGLLRRRATHQRKGGGVARERAEKCPRNGRRRVGWPRVLQLIIVPGAPFRAKLKSVRNNEASMLKVDCHSFFWCVCCSKSVSNLRAYGTTSLTRGFWVDLPSFFRERIIGCSRHVGFQRTYQFLSQQQRHVGFDRGAMVFPFFATYRRRSPKRLPYAGDIFMAVYAGRQRQRYCMCERF